MHRLENILNSSTFVLHDPFFLFIFLLNSKSWLTNVQKFIDASSLDQGLLGKLATKKERWAEMSSLFYTRE